MSDLLFDSPWWLWGTLAVVGAIVGWTGIQRQQKNNIFAGLGLILLAVVLKSISFMVVTDKEICTKQSTELINYFDKRDWDHFSGLMDPDVSLGTPDSTILHNRRELLDTVQFKIDAFDPKNIGSHVGTIEQDPTGITVDLDVSAESGKIGYRLPTSWKLTWIKVDKDWKLHQILCTKIGVDNPNQMAHDIGR